MTFAGNVIVLVLMVGLIFSGAILLHSKRHHAWYMQLFNSRDSQVQLHLYFGMVSLFSLFFYTGYAVAVRSFAFDMLSFGKAIGITFTGVGIGAAGHGLQLKEDGNIHFVSVGHGDGDGDVNADENTALFARLCDLSDTSLEMHLFLGAFAIILVILYTGYDLAYTAKDFHPFDYGQALAYTFAGVGAAGWGQGIARKFQQKSDQTNPQPE